MLKNMMESTDELLTEKMIFVSIKDNFSELANFIFCFVNQFC